MSKTASQVKETSVNCPHCKASVLWNKESIYRPFCSKRCRLIDLGDWADESHKISSEFYENPDDFVEGSFE